MNRNRLRTGFQVVLFVSVMAAATWLGCRDAYLSAPEPSTPKGTPADDRITSAVDFTADFDAFVERENVGSCTAMNCDSTSHTIHPDCTTLRSQYWKTSMCASTLLLLDFDTEPMPDSAVVTDVKLRLYYLESDGYPQATQPDEPGCTLAQSPASRNFGLGSFYAELPGSDPQAGDSLTPNWILAPVYCSSTNLGFTYAGQNFAKTPTGRWIDVLIADNKVSLQKVSRYVLDREAVSEGDSVRGYLFEASEHQGSHPPTLRVKYKVPFGSTCLDGEAAHNNQNCSSCADADFTFNTSAQTANVRSDSSQTGFCSEKQAVFIFETAPLHNTHTISSATLKFTVKTITSVDVTTVRLRVYGKGPSGACPGSLANGDFIGCGSDYTDLGLITVSGTGQKTFTVPSADSNVNKTGLTKFVFVDASVFSTEDGSQITEIWTNDAATSSVRPSLEVVYD